MIEKKTRRQFLKQTALGAAALTLPQLAASAPAATPALAGAPQNPLNVLFIVCDDLRPELGCYGVSGIQAPNIDKLAAEGLVFRRAYCQQAVCAPSRASFLSGLRPDSTGVFDLGHPLRKQKPNVITLPQVFKKSGYETVSIGKIYHHANDDQRSWTRMPWLGKNFSLYLNETTMASVRKRQAEAKARGLGEVAAYNYSVGPATECAATGDDNAYEEGLIADEALRQMRELKDKPFLLCVGFHRPHLPFNAPKKYWDLYRREDFKVPERKPPLNAPKVALADFGELRAYSDIPDLGPLSDEQTRELIHGYHAAVSYVDVLIGKVLAGLDQNGLRDNTVVVLIGDHGWKLGEYGMWCKHTNFEYDTHAPLIVRAPGAKAGAASEALVEFVDIFPTLADLCGLKAPATCEGTSFRPLLSDPNRPWKSAAFSQYPRGKSAEIMGYSLRSGQWRYTEWRLRKNGTVLARELYDQSHGAFAPENLVDKPALKSVVADLEKKMRDGWRAARPQ